MTLLDDDVDDLLRRFRADEAVLDDDIRTRMWARICDDVPDARVALDALAPSAGVRHLRARPRRPSTRVLAVAAAVVVLMAVAAVVLRPGSGPGDRAVTAGPPTEQAAVADLQDLADAVADLPVPVLGSSPETAYAHRVLERTTETTVADPVAVTEEVWVALDGTGRLLITRAGAVGRDETMDRPGSLRLGLLDPAVAVGLPDDADAVVAAIGAQRARAEGEAVAVVPGDLSRELIETLAFPGLPGPARAGILRVLDRWGFAPVTDGALAPNLLRVEGPGPDGSVVQADFDLRTGEVVASTHFGPDGYVDVRTTTAVDLRADTRGP